MLPQSRRVVGVVQSVDVCEPPGDAAYGDQPVARDGQLAVGVRLDVLEQFGSADSVPNSGGVEAYLLGPCFRYCDAE